MLLVLQVIRGRLQDALAAEARATAGERTARERLEASAAEREAAVERTRAACEAHYITSRRRLESQLSAEHERALFQLKQEAILARSVSCTLTGFSTFHFVVLNIFWYKPENS